MPAALPNPTDCCNSLCSEEITVLVPGSSGADGEDGTGTDGLNAFTSLTAGFTMPAISSNVSISVVDNTWVAVLQVVFIENAGYMKVIGKTSTTGLTVQNTGYSGNVAGSTAVANGGLVSPGGLAGIDGSAGSNGDDGINSYTSTSANFTMPAVDATVSVSLTDGSWLGVGQTVHVVGAGFMQCTAKATSYSVTLKNLDVTGNAAPTTVISSGAVVSPSGPVGSFNGPAGGDLKGNYPDPKIAVANTKGSIPVGDGTDTTAVAVGVNDTVLTADSAQTNGVKWSSAFPAGVIMPYAGATIPTGWLECDGSSLLRASYANLFTAIGTTWGSADGTHFNAPDFRGRALIGAGTGSGLTARTLGNASIGAEDYTLLNTDIPDLSPQSTITPAMTGATAPYKLLSSQWDNTGPEYSMDGSDAVNPRVAEAAQTDVPLMQPSAVVKWMIKT